MDVRRPLALLDWKVLRSAGAGQVPGTHTVLPFASSAANDGKLWIGVAMMLAAAGGRRGRRAAGEGLASVVVASVACTGLKRIVRRRRPGGWGALGMRRRGRAPVTSSFPSQHSASAAAFAVAAGTELPFAFPLLSLLAGAVCWSRMYNGRHFPSDVGAGVLVGVVAGLGVRTSTGHLLPAEPHLEGQHDR